MAGSCKHCGERAAVRGALAWYGRLFAGSWINSRACCADCAGGLNFIGLLALSVIAIAAFVLIVISW